jgi:exoribonuclease R
MSTDPMMMRSRQNQQQQQQQHVQHRRQRHRHDFDSHRRQDDPWLHRSFLKDTKLRIRERYWRALRCEAATASSLPSLQQRYIVIPCALTWRKFLPWIETIFMDNNHTEDGCDDDSSRSLDGHVAWYLLESVVENMDYRNQSPVIDNHSLDNIKNGSHKMRESAVPQERSTLLKLFRKEEERQQQSSSSSTGRRLHAFCDLSFRSSNTDETEDEWDILHYEYITTQERSRHAIVRAAQMIRDCCRKRSHEHADYMADDATATTRSIILLVEDDDDDNDEFNQDEQQEEGIPVIRNMKIHDLLDLWRRGGLVDDEQYKQYSNLLQSSHENYVRRNSLKQLITSPTTEADREDDCFVPEQEEEYWSDERIQQGLAQKLLIQGRLEVTKENPREAFVSVSAADQQQQQQQHQQQHADNGDDRSIIVKHYFVDASRGHFNRALHQDTVILQPLPKKAWGYPVGKRRLVVPMSEDDKELDNATDSTTVSSSSLLSSSELLPSFPSARVVAIANPTARRRNIVATLVDVPLDVGESSALLVVPMDVCIPKTRLVGGNSKSWHKYVGKRLLVDLIHPASGGWPVTSRYPQAYCRDILGPVGDIETEIACLLYENQIDFALHPFSLAARACLPTLTASGRDDAADGDNDDAGDALFSWTIPRQEIAHRRDLRNYCIFSVDPPGCQDIDDTMHVCRLPNGQVEIGVHIADVTYFVPQGSALDREAQVRGTTFYLVDRRFDMLPSLLSSNLCSLHGGTDRLAVSVIWTLSSDLREVVSTWFGRTIIHNVAAMTYDQADNILEGKPPDEAGSKRPPPLTAGSPVDRALIPTLREHLALLTQVARQRRGQREEIGGAVDLSSSGGKEDENVGSNELKFNLVNGEPVAVKPKQDKEIHHTVSASIVQICDLNVISPKTSHTFNCMCYCRLPSS